jgi:hypothetical protein
MKEKVFIIAHFLKIPFKFQLFKEFDVSNDFINLKNMKIQSHIDYLSEFGVIISRDSKEEGKISDILIYAKNLKKVLLNTPLHFKNVKNVNNSDNFENNQHFKAIFHPSPFNFEKTLNSLDYFKMKYSRMPATETNPSFSDLEKRKPKFFFFENRNEDFPGNAEFVADQSEAENYLSADRNEKLAFSLSNLAFYLIKNVFNNPQIVFQYSEIDKTSMFLQVFVHLPVLILFISIFVLVAWFENGTSEGIIQEEISKLPLQKYNSSLDMCECSICLDSFNEDEYVRILHCKHCFHQNCIDSWLRNMLRCPICRSSVSKLAESSSYQIYQSLNNI